MRPGRRGNTCSRARPTSSPPRRSRRASPDGSISSRCGPCRWERSRAARTPSSTALPGAWKTCSINGMARLLLSTTGAELVVSHLAKRLGIDRTTADAYEPWIETTFLVHRLPAWSRKVASKLVHRAKLHACDTGLAAAVMGKGPEALARLNDTSVGPLVESFVVAEIAKQLTWSDASARLHHVRDRDGLEVDAIMCSTPATEGSPWASASSACRSRTSGPDLPTDQRPRGDRPRAGSRTNTAGPAPEGSEARYRYGRDVTTRGTCSCRSRAQPSASRTSPSSPPGSPEGRPARGLPRRGRGCSGRSPSRCRS